MKKGRIYAILKAPSTKHQAPSTKHQAPSTKHKLGFTLSELLVSLAVLGLIAGLTVPSIVASVEKSKNKAMLKEAFQLVSSITQEGVLNGSFEGISNWDITSTASGGIVDYFTSKFNYSKQCLVGDVLSEGCKAFYVDDGSIRDGALINHSARWILPNGSRIQTDHQSTVSASWMFWVITTKATARNWRFFGTNINSLNIACNTSQQKQTVNLIVLNPGQCRGTRSDYEAGLTDMLFAN